MMGHQSSYRLHGTVLAALEQKKMSVVVHLELTNPCRVKHDLSVRKGINPAADILARSTGQLQFPPENVPLPHTTKVQYRNFRMRLDFKRKRFHPCGLDRASQLTN